jgi:hypothetical protein
MKHLVTQISRYYHRASLLTDYMKPTDAQLKPLSIVAFIKCLYPYICFKP